MDSRFRGNDAGKIFRGWGWGWGWDWDWDWDWDWGWDWDWDSGKRKSKAVIPGPAWLHRAGTRNPL
jgi:hypothetical protein